MEIIDKCTDNQNIKIWRYMNIAKFLYLLGKKELYFTKVSSFDDPYEGKVGNATRIREKSRQPLEKQRKIAAYYNSIEDMAEKCFVNCWHMNENESVAMWKVYAENDMGIAIQTSVERLKDALKNKGENDTENYKVYLQKVNYCDFENETLEIDECVEVLFHKRKEFEFEKELRIVIVDENTTESFYKIKVDITQLIENVYISPLAHDYYENVIRDVLKRYGFGKKAVIKNNTLLKRTYG